MEYIGYISSEQAAQFSVQAKNTWYFFVVFPATRTFIWFLHLGSFLFELGRLIIVNKFEVVIVSSWWWDYPKYQLVILSKGGCPVENCFNPVFYLICGGDLAIQIHPGVSSYGGSHIHFWFLEKFHLFLKKVWGRYVKFRLPVKFEVKKHLFTLNQGSPPTENAPESAVLEMDCHGHHLS